MSREELAVAVVRHLSNELTESWFSNNPYSATTGPKFGTVQVMGRSEALCGNGHIAISRNKNVSIHTLQEANIPEGFDYYGLGAHVDVSENGDYVLAITKSNNLHGCVAVIYAYSKEEKRYNVSSVNLLEDKYINNTYVYNDGTLNNKILRKLN